jgi:phage tail-like protein
VVTTNANNETWYMLRYATDFAPRPAGVPAFQSPQLDDTLLWDDQRHVLELRPAAPTDEAQPPPGIAVDPDGIVYRSDPGRARVVVTHCDGSERSLVREPGVFVSPAGLALDRRGLLYVADPIAQRVVVVLPDKRSVEAVLAQGLVEPVDVAVSPEVHVFVADRAGGVIICFNGRFERCAEFTPRNADGLPAQPKPIAVMVDADGSVLVADATYPRLLRFAPDGTPLPDVDAAARVRSVTANGVTLDALGKIYGARMPRFLAGVCRPTRPHHDGGEALAAAHLAIRLLLLHLDHSFAPSGAWVSACLDGGSPGVQWDKIVLDADIPAGCSIQVDAQSIDDLSLLGAFASNEAETTAPLTDLHERLLFTPPGRYLRLRLKLQSDGTATPSVRSVRVFYPRVSYLDLLPRVFRRDADAAAFLGHFLALFEHTLTRVEDRYERFWRDLNPATVPADAVDWLASLVDLAFDPSWSLAKKRALLENIMELYRTRGTVHGIKRYIELYTGERPEILEGFLERPLQSPALGAQGIRLGATTLLSATSARVTPESLLEHRFANRFTVFVYSTDECDDNVLLAVVVRIVATSRPAHAAYSLRLVRPDARVGAARVGLDVLLGAREAPGTRLGGCPEPGAPAKGRGVLGVDSVLGDTRPGYARQQQTTL